MLKNFSARFARGINHCSAPAAPFCLYTLSRSRIPANQLTTGGRAKMTEATQTTFFRDFFGKEMSENAGLANQLTTGGARQNDGGYSNDIFPRFFRQRDVRKFRPRIKFRRTTRLG